MWSWIIATILAFSVKGLCGFGDGLIFSTFMSFVSSYTAITPVATIMSFPSNAIITWKERKNLVPRIFLPITIVMLIGDCIGVSLLKTLDTQLLKVGFGFLIVLLGVEMFLRERSHKTYKSNPVVLWIIGIGAGILCGLFAIGALLTAYFSRVTDTTGSFRGNICAVFAADNLFRIILYCITGVITGEIFLRALMLLPIMLLALSSGIYLSHVLDDKLIKKIVIVMLIISGISLILTNL